MRLVLIILCFSLTGCIESEDCHTTGEVDHYRTRTTEFYTITEPVYKTVCE